MTFTHLPIISCFRRLPFRRHRPVILEQNSTSTLADVPPGAQAEVESFLAGLSDERQAHLRAYGLAPGSRVQVKQHRPVTVVQIDHTELAMEAVLARQVGVQNISSL